MAEKDNIENEAPAGSTEFGFRYAGPSQLVSEETPRLALYGNLNREPVFLDALVKDPLRFREALAAVYAVVGSDYRYIPKDRTAYHAYRRMKNQTANLGAWQAQHAYFDWLARNDPFAFLILDPVISVHPDKLFLEVFSKDEGTYANLSVSMEAFDVEQDPVFGTTNIDFSPQLFRAVEQFRSYRETRLTIGQQAVQIQTEGTESVLEKKIQVPDSWLRGFLQVQSSAMLPRYRFKMKPMELYNVLRHLRLNKDQKGKRRGLRIELVPGELPRVVIEPWETVIECQTEVYQGSQSKVIRVWGRRRLMLLRRMLPLVDEIEVHLTGSGLPSFWVLRAGAMTFTLGVTGFTASNWSQSVNFDLMLPRADEASDEKVFAKMIKKLAGDWSADREALGKSCKLQGQELVANLQRGCQHGQLMFDLADDVYRLRPLTEQPLNWERLEYRNQGERQAFDLVLRQAAVSITRENRIYGSGLELTGKAKVKEDRREYSPQLLISDEGFVRKAECTCSVFRKQGLKSGPCPHLIALRIAHAIREKVRRETGEGDDSICVETRTFTQRIDSNQETVYQITLDEHRLKVRWGNPGSSMRMQQFRFPSTTDAREDYLQRVEELLAKGFLDAS